jgi:nucleoside-diphosphate-sugar epimerase
MARIVVTGANGFLGQALVQALAKKDTDDSVLLLDRNQAPSPDTRFSAVCADLSEPGAIADLVGDADLVFHLAALPGGAAELDPSESRAVNLNASLDLISHLSSPGRPARLVYASSIAVFGSPLPPHIDDMSMPLPGLTYGAHKLMVEIALADSNRRGDLQGVALRLPGLVARPRSGAGFSSAFMSEIFRAVIERHPYTLPVSREATVWLMSARTAAANLIHGSLRAHDLVTRPVLTLPALRVTMGDLVAALGRATRSDPIVTYAPDEAIEAQFGRLPPLDASLARAAGYRDDGDVDGLVNAVLADLAVENRS